MKTSNNLLENCTSLSQVVDLINDLSASDLSAEKFAIAYALDAVNDAECGFNRENIEAHLDVLVVGGACFDYGLVLNILFNEEL